MKGKEALSLLLIKQENDSQHAMTNINSSHLHYEGRKYFVSTANMHTDMTSFHFRGKLRKHSQQTDWIII